MYRNDNTILEYLVKSIFMKIHRFFTPEHIQAHSTFRSEDGDFIHQLKDVFRMKRGEKVVLFDGTGYEYEATIELLTKKEAMFLVGEGIEKEDKGSGAHLFLSIIKKDNFELAIEKATELGVTTITPVIAERSQYKSIRQDRLQKIIKEAAEQCGRVTLPNITPELSLEETLEQYPDITVLDIDGQEGEIGTKNILVGPEGGWSDKERALFEERSVAIKSLPFNTLRAETAVIAAIALL